jgi:hypothetical protein
LVFEIANGVRESSLCRGFANELPRSAAIRFRENPQRLRDIFSRRMFSIANSAVLANFP